MAVADIVIRDLMIDGGGGLDFVGVTTNGQVRVEGAVDFANADAEDLLQIIAGERLEVLTPPGRISMREAQGELPRQLTLSPKHTGVAESSPAGQPPPTPKLAE